MSHEAPPASEAPQPFAASTNGGVTLNESNETVVVPRFCSVTCLTALNVPITTSPKSTLAGDGTRFGVPTPVSGTTSGLGAPPVLVSPIEPFRVPSADGTNCAASWHVSPGCSVCAKHVSSGERKKSPPLPNSPLKKTSVEPTFWTVDTTASLRELIGCEPKSNEVGVTVRFGAPVPLTGIESGFGAPMSLKSTNVPLYEASAVGVNCTAAVHESPGCSVCAKHVSLPSASPKPGATIDSPLKKTSTSPVFCTVADPVTLDPTGTEPNAIELGVTLSVPAACACGATSPSQAPVTSAAAAASLILMILSPPNPDVIASGSWTRRTAIVNEVNAVRESARGYLWMTMLPPAIAVVGSAKSPPPSWLS